MSGVRFPAVDSQAIVTVNFQNAEVALVTNPPFTPSFDGSRIFLIWYLAVTLGTGFTNLTLRVRRGSGTGGTLVNVALAATVTASQALYFSGSYADTPGAVAGQQYTLTAQGTGATGNATVNDVSMLAFAL